MAKITVVTEGNIFPGTVTIAELARNTDGLERRSQDLDIYEVEEIMTKAWKWEIAEWSYEYGSGYSATFKDGSEIHIGAWAANPTFNEADSYN